MHKKITILLGAGFAMYLKGCGTKDINEEFAADVKYSVKGQSLYNFIKDCYSNILSDFSFETYLAVLETILSYVRSKEITSADSIKNKDMLAGLFKLVDVINRSGAFSSAERCWDILRYFYNRLITMVSKYDNRCCCKKESDSFKDFIHRLQSTYCQVKIYSTNYDTLVPQIFKDEWIEQGLQKVDGSDSIFTYNLIQFTNARLSYFPLHGCINLHRLPFNKIAYSNSSKDVPQEALSSEAGNPNGLHLFLPIISGYDKLSHANGKPFNFGFQAFGNDCHDSDFILTLGFSYSDPHINFILSTFSKARIVSVNRNPSQNLPIDLDVETSPINDIAELLNKPEIIDEWMSAIKYSN